MDKDRMMDTIKRYIASQAVTYRSGLIPCWVSTYQTVLDGSSVYDEIVKKMKW